MRSHPLMFGEDREPPKPVDRDIDMARLRDYEAEYNRHKTFRPGQLLSRIDNSHLSPNNLYVVLEVIDNTWVKMDPNDLSTYGTRFDLRVMWYDQDGDACVMPTDSRLFTEVKDVG